MFWRQISNYENNTIAEILSRLSQYNKNELKNIHLLILISQNKIEENLIIDLSKSLDYTIVKELLLTQFDITKYGFYQN